MPNSRGEKSVGGVFLSRIVVVPGAAEATDDNAEDVASTA